MTTITTIAREVIAADEKASKDWTYGPHNGVGCIETTQQATNGDLYGRSLFGVLDDVPVTEQDVIDMRAVALMRNHAATLARAVLAREELVAAARRLLDSARRTHPGFASEPEHSAERIIAELGPALDVLSTLKEPDREP